MQKDEYWMILLSDQPNRESEAILYANIDKLDLKSKLFYLINVEIQLHPSFTNKSIVYCSNS